MTGADARPVNAVRCGEDRPFVPYAPRCTAVSESQRANHQHPENRSMKASMLGLCFLVVTTASSVSAQQTTRPATPPPTKAEQEVLDLARVKWRWMSEKKVDTLAA